jgi:hypothetical protein
VFQGPVEPGSQLAAKDGEGAIGGSLLARPAEQQRRGLAHCHDLSALGLPMLPQWLEMWLILLGELIIFWILFLAF